MSRKVGRLGELSSPGTDLFSYALNDDGDTFSGTPTITTDQDDVTISDETVNVAAVTIDGTSYAAGTVVTFRATAAAGFTATTCQVTISYTTTTNAAERIVGGDNGSLFIEIEDTLCAV